MDHSDRCGGVDGCESTHIFLCDLSDDDFYPEYLTAINKDAARTAENNRVAFPHAAVEAERKFSGYTGAGIVGTAVLCIFL